MSAAWGSVLSCLRSTTSKCVVLKVASHALPSPDPPALPSSLQRTSAAEASPEPGLAISCLVPLSALLSLDHFLPCWTPPFLLPFSHISTNSRVIVCIRLLTEGYRAVGEWSTAQGTTSESQLGISFTVTNPSLPWRISWLCSPLSFRDPAPRRGLSLLP